MTAPEGTAESQLAARACEPCRGGVPPLHAAQIAALTEGVPGWSVVDPHHLTRGFEFEDFAGALAFTNRVGEIAEREGHHPDIHLSWGRVRLDIWTHKIDGLTESDFVLAAKCSRAYAAPGA